MNKPVATRVFENLRKYDPVVKLLGEKHPEFSRTIDLVSLAVQGLAKYYGLFILDQHGKLIFAARLEDDYSRNVTLIGRELKTWARNPDLTLRGKIGLTRLYSVLERCLRDALELYKESERELIKKNIKIYMSTSDAYGEYERAKAALWKFQHDFHLHQIDFHRGSDRAIIYSQPGFAGPPVGFVNNFEFTRPDWKEPDEDCIKVLTEEEQTQLKSFISRPEVQKLLPSNLRNPNVSLPPSPVEDDDSGDRATPVPSKKIGPLIKPKSENLQRRKGILKDPRFEAPRDKPKKTVRFGRHREPPLPSDNVQDGPPPVDALYIWHTLSEPPSTVPLDPPPVVSSEPSQIRIIPPSDTRSSPTSSQSSSSSSDDPIRPQRLSPNPVQPVTKTTPLFTSVSFDSADFAVPKNTGDTPSSAISISSSSSSSSSSTLPSVSSLSSTLSCSSTEGGDKNATASNSSDDETTTTSSTTTSSTTTSSTTTGSEKSEERPLARTPVEVRRKVGVAVRAFLGRRHDEYSLALAVDPDTEFAEDEDDTLDGSMDGSMDGTMKGSMDSSMNDSVDGSVDGPEDDIKDLPYDDEASAAHLQLTHTARQNTAHDVGGTALLHWAGVTKAKREERIEGHRRLRAILKWAEREGHVPLSPTSIRATTGLRRGIFTPLGPPDLPPPRRRSRRRVDPEAYCDTTLENLKKLRPLLDLTLLAFLSNQDALRLFGRLVGEHPLPSDLGRMDKVLRELEVYTEVCAHRRRLIVDHLKRTRKFPLALAAQSGDLRAALQDAEEAKLAASRRCFEYVAERSQPVMGYPGGKRRRREFAGQFLVRDRQKLEYLSGVEDEAAALREELEEAEEWQEWCEEVMGEWTLGWRPGRVEKDMLYVDEETQADVRRYKWEINQKRAAIGLVPVRRPQDEVYRRQQEHIELLDILWKLMS